MTYTVFNRRIATSFMLRGWRLLGVRVNGRFVDWIVVRDVGAKA